MDDLKTTQIDCCKHYGADANFIRDDQLIVISKGIYEGKTPVEGVRYPSPNHMTGWWLTTDEYDGNTESLQTVHSYHVCEKRPDLAIYLALPFGFRFNLGGTEEYVWYDEDVGSESV